MRNNQEYYRQKYQLIKPDWQDSLKIYISCINQFVSQRSSILDIGCGHADFLSSVYQKTPEVYGLDPDSYALSRNTTITYKLCGLADHIPFPDNTFDLVSLAWVLEHIEEPEKVFTEIHRVLKPGGKMIFLTPNAWNYVTWINRLIPNVFHDSLVRYLYNRQENDTYPVRYRLNSVRSIDKLLRSLDFKQEQMTINGDPSYISFSDILFKLSCCIEKFLDIGILRYAKVHLIGVYHKK